MRIFFCSCCKKWNTGPDKPSETWAEQNTLPESDDVIYCVCPSCKTENLTSLKKATGVSLGAEH